MKPLKIAVLPGDGIGIEVMEVALEVFQYLDIPHEFLFGEIGYECWKKEGNTVPKVTWDIIEQADATLLGAITSKPLAEAEQELAHHLRNKGYQFISPVIQLRQKLGLFANVRPIFDVLAKKPRFNFCIIRENTKSIT
jgi:3-isopropylmalate dehydrogenase